MVAMPWGERTVSRTGCILPSSTARLMYSSGCLPTITISVSGVGVTVSNVYKHSTVRLVDKLEEVKAKKYFQKQLHKWNFPSSRVKQC